MSCSALCGGHCSLLRNFDDLALVNNLHNLKVVFLPSALAVVLRDSSFLLDCFLDVLHVAFSFLSAPVGWGGVAPSSLLAPSRLEVLGGFGEVLRLGGQPVGIPTIEVVVPNLTEGVLGDDSDLLGVDPIGVIEVVGVHCGVSFHFVGVVPPFDNNSIARYLI